MLSRVVENTSTYNLNNGNILREVMKARKEILRKKKEKRGIEIQWTKVEKKEKKEKMLRKVVVKIGLKQKEEKKEVVTKTLLNSRTMGLVMSEEFTRRHKFKRT